MLPAMTLRLLIRVWCPAYLHVLFLTALGATFVSTRSSCGYQSDYWAIGPEGLMLTTTMTNVNAGMVP